jgi:hypothetical protein
VNKVDLNLFFKNNGNISIYTKEYQIHPDYPADLAALLKEFIKKKYFFISENEKFKHFEPNSDFYFKEKKVNLYRLQRLIHTTKDKWDVFYPEIPFPVIHVQNHALDYHSNFIAYDKDSKKGVIYVDGETFSDYQKFKSTLGHELGHLVHIVYENKPENYKFNHFNTLSIIMILNLLVQVFVFINRAKNENGFDMTYTLVPLITISPFMLVYFLNYTSFNERMRRYNMELFCDFFSFKFMEINYYKRPKLFQFGDNYLGFSHPRGITRLNHIKNNRKKEKFTKISQRHAEFFQFCNIDHLIEHYIGVIKLRIKSYWIVIKMLLNIW